MDEDKPAEGAEGIEEVEDISVDESSEESGEVAEEGVSEGAEGAEEDADSAGLLITRQKYLASGIHIGMKQHTAQMMQFVYKIRPDGLAVMNLRVIDERIRIAAKFLAHNRKIMVVSRRSIAHKAMEKFTGIVGGKAITGRFMPGTLTNPKYASFYEADVLMVVDPMSDQQAVAEAVTARIPVVAVCDTFNETNNVDLIIPANNKGAKAVGLLFWMLAREIQKERGEIKSDDEFKHSIDDFAQDIDQRERDYDRDYGDDSRGASRGASRGGARGSSRGFSRGPMRGHGLSGREAGFDRDRRSRGGRGGPRGGRGGRGGRNTRR